jgi:hypothetical protein
MRVELSGTAVRPDALVVMFVGNLNFDISKYMELGYTHFEAVCIGGGGGRGGGIDTEHAGSLIRNYGGAGGGGGYHRVKGLLSILPFPTCAVVVGAAGTVGSDHISDPTLTTHGGNGGYSSFNDTTCRASGGEGGKKVGSNSDSVTTGAHGGAGGSGNSITAGDGGAAGVAGTPSSTGPGIPGTPGADGVLAGNIGEGGGGGAGGVGKYFGTEGITLNEATAGGKGSYILGDTTVYGPGSAPSNDPDTGTENTVPGIAGGAKAYPVNRLPAVYGQSGTRGVVILRLTSE